MMPEDPNSVDYSKEQIEEWKEEMEEEKDETNIYFYADADNLLNNDDDTEQGTDINED